MKLKFKSKNLEEFYFYGSTRGLPVCHKKIKKSLIDLTFTPEVKYLFDENYVTRGFRLHKLDGDRSDQYSIVLTGNLRLIFKVINDFEILILNIEDYH